MKWLGGVMLVLSILPASAQKSVFQNLTWEQAAALAEKEGKIVFVDAMRKPMNAEAKQAQDKMAQAIFKAEGVTEFVKKNTVAIQIDMGSEEGKAFAPKLVMNMYPTYGFFMPDGDILGVVSPFSLTKDPQLLVKKGEEFLKAAEVKRANTRSIAFEELTYEEALKKAQKENKLVFIDAYTAWCQPCVMMTKNIFTLNSVADFYNENFINVKLDFGKDKALAEKFDVHGYPAFIFVNGKGKAVYMAGGYSEEDKFIGYGKEALKQAEGIAFEKGAWKDILNKAKAENKPVFVDCYTSWCGPCKMLAKEVFTDPDVAKVFNEKFVNAKVDMEKGEGPALKEQYGVNAYPTLLFLNGDGELQHCIVGGMPAEELLKQAGLALEGKGLAALEKAYNAGNREPEFIETYMTALDLANRGEVAEQVCIDYFATLDKAKLSERKYWDLFAKYVKDVDSDVFAYVYEHRNELVQAIGEKEVKNKIRMVYIIGANRFVTGQGEETAFDQKGFNRYCKRLKKTDVEGVEDIISDARMNNAEKLGDWKTYIDLGDEKVAAGHVGDMILYNWGLRVDRMCKDQTLRERAAVWFDKAIEACNKREAEGKKAGMMSFKPHFEKVAADLRKTVE